MRQAVDLALAHRLQGRQAAPIRHAAQRGARGPGVVFRADDKAAGLLQMRASGGDVDVGIALDHELQVQLARWLFQHLGADVAGADEGQIVADVASPDRVAAVGSITRVGLQKDGRSLFVL
ncbi:hypothetical protein D3C81_1795780 [compost metagenome]